MGNEDGKKIPRKGYQKTKTRNQKNKKTNIYISYYGQDLPTQAYFVFEQDCSRTKNYLHRQHLVLPFSRVSVQCYGRAMRAGIIGGAPGGFACLACLVSAGSGCAFAGSCCGWGVHWGLVCRGCLLTITLFSLMRWLCESPFVF